MHAQNRRQFFAASAAPIALAVTGVGLAIAASDPPDPAHEAIRRLAPTVESARVKLAETIADIDRFDDAHPGPREGGTVENLEASWAFVRDRLDPDTSAFWAAVRSMEEAIAIAGARGVLVGGKLYLSLDSERWQNGDHLGIDRALILDLDAKGGAR